MNFSSISSLDGVVKVINEAEEATKDEKRTIKESAIPDVLFGAAGGTLGGAASFAALYGLGTVGLSAAGISSGLAAAGGIVGGGMAAGVFVLAAPIAVLAAGGVGISMHLRKKQLLQEKQKLYQQALSKHNAIIKALKEEVNASKERIDYLNGLNVLLQHAIKDLKEDLKIA